jgi:hypothetical protein
MNYHKSQINTLTGMDQIAELANDLVRPETKGIADKFKDLRCTYEKDYSFVVGLLKYIFTHNELDWYLVSRVSYRACSLFSIYSTESNLCILDALMKAFTLNFYDAFRKYVEVAELENFEAFDFLRKCFVALRETQQRQMFDHICPFVGKLLEGANAKERFDMIGTLAVHGSYSDNFMTFACGDSDFGKPYPLAPEIIHIAIKDGITVVMGWYSSEILTIEMDCIHAEIANAVDSIIQLMQLVDEPPIIPEFGKIALLSGYSSNIEFLIEKGYDFNEDPRILFSYIHPYYFKGEYGNREDQKRLLQVLARHRRGFLQLRRLAHRAEEGWYNEDPKWKEYLERTRK